MAGGSFRPFSASDRGGVFAGVFCWGSPVFQSLRSIDGSCSTPAIGNTDKSQSRFSEIQLDPISVHDEGLLLLVDVSCCITLEGGPFLAVLSSQSCAGRNVFDCFCCCCGGGGGGVRRSWAKLTVGYEFKNSLLKSHQWPTTV